VCNGHAELCARPLDEVAFPATHNSMSSAERGWLIPNQNLAIPGQLDGGIRGLNIDLWTNDAGDLVFCHTHCELGEQDMVEGFAEIDRWLQANPQEVLLLTLESQVPEADAVWALEGSGLAARAHAQELGEPWPTLAQLVDAGTPVVVFSSQASGDVPWHMVQWDHWLDTPYGHESVEALGDTKASCDLERGNPDTASLFNINHFITAPVASATQAALANEEDPMAERVHACEAQTGRPVNQVLVDFFDLGGVLAVTDEVNLSGN